MAAVTPRGKITPVIMDEIAEDLASLIEAHVRSKMKLVTSTEKTSRMYADEAIIRGQINAFLFLAAKLGVQEELQSKANAILKSKTAKTADC